MNRLLTKYCAIQNAIFDHCGIPIGTRGGPIETSDDVWRINARGYLAMMTPARTIVYSYPPVIFRGPEFTLAFLDRADDEWHPDHVWLALDNALEVKP